MNRRISIMGLNLLKYARHEISWHMFHSIITKVHVCFVLPHLINPTKFVIGSPLNCASNNRIPFRKRQFIYAPKCPKWKLKFIVSSNVLFVHCDSPPSTEKQSTLPRRTRFYRFFLLALIWFLCPLVSYLQYPVLSWKTDARLALHATNIFNIYWPWAPCYVGHCQSFNMQTHPLLAWFSFPRIAQYPRVKYCFAGQTKRVFIHCSKKLMDFRYVPH